jgi:hypothetical protein
LYRLYQKDIWPGSKEKKKELSLLPRKRKKLRTGYGTNVRSVKNLYIMQSRLRINMYAIIVTTIFV